MLTTAAAAAWLAHLFQNAAWANVGDTTGLRGSSVAGSLYISLHNADPGAAGDQTTHETAYGGYGRIGVARSAAGWTVTGTNVANTASVTFPQCLSGTDTISHFGIGTDGSGAGHLLAWGPLAGAFMGMTAEIGTAIVVPGSAFVIDDRIVFYAASSDAALPAGLTAGTVYFVKTATGDTVTVAATSGGAAIPVTVAGAGFAAKASPLAVAIEVTPDFAVAELVALGQ